MIKKEKKNVKKKVNKKGSHSIDNRRRNNNQISKRENERTLRDKHIDQEDIDVETYNKQNDVSRRVKYSEEIENNGKPRRTKAEVKRNLKRLFVLILIIFIVLLIFYTISLLKWYSIMKNIMRCENSVILDSNGNVIAVIGENRIQENVEWEHVPDNLKNAYISIEDKNYKKHMGISIKRTGGAILTYITHKGSSSFGGSTITQQVIKNVTGENETKITRKITEWDRAIKTEILFSKDDILRTYFNVIYVGPNVYGVKMGARYYFDKDVRDLSLAECAFMAGLTHSPNSYNPFNNSNNKDKIKNRTITVLNVMLQEGYISKDDYDVAVEEVNNGLKFKQGKVEAKGDGIYSYMADATMNEVIQDLSEEKHISNAFATNYLYFGGLRINSTQNSDIQKVVEDECKKNRYILKSNNIKNATSQAAMVIIDQKKRICCCLCRRTWRKKYSKRV